MARITDRLTARPRLPRPYARRVGAVRLADPAEPLTAAPTSHAQGRHTVRVLMNVTRGPHSEYVNFSGYLPGHCVAEAGHCGDGPLVLTVDATDPETAADRAFVIGNLQDHDVHGRTWPGDVRSVSVGDVMCVTDPTGTVHHLAVAPSGFERVDAPCGDRIVPLTGTTATSR
ncbi:hypothetical protein ACFVZ3_14485 [Kitasatospora purpeofusca]|uniref:hypothetical protein n=1 Tax=Kitasatospora purpeofusca TaxID=67352 RepID=UPI0036790E44